MKIDLVNYLKEYFNLYPGYSPDLLSLKEYLPLKLQSQFSDHFVYYVMKKLLIEFDINDIDDDTDEDTDELCVTNSSNTLSDMLSLYPLVSDQIEGKSIDENDYDFVITIGKRKFFLHKFVLGFRCNELLEKDINSISEKILEESFIYFIKWIYDGTIDVEFFAQDNLIQILIDLCFLFKDIALNDDIHDYLFKLLYRNIKLYDNDKISDLIIKLIEKNSPDYIIFLMIKHLKENNYDKVKLLNIIDIIDDNDLLNTNDDTDKYIDNIINSDDIINEFNFIDHYKDDLMKLSNDRYYIDIIFKFNDEKIYCNKALLYYRFPLIKKLKIDYDNGLINMDDRDNNSIIHLNFESFETLINYYYTYDTSNIYLSKDNYKFMILLYHFLSLNKDNKLMGYIDPLFSKLYSIIEKDSPKDKLLSYVLNYLLLDLKNEWSRQLVVKYLEKISKVDIDYNSLDPKAKRKLSLFF